MCGIAGGWWRSGPDKLKGLVGKSLALLQHRGPNDQGQEYISLGEGVLAIGHTRLSVIDLSSGGHQPVKSSCGRYLMVFNGEIYNYRELRERLRARGCAFSTESDSEVLLAAWSTWGLASLRLLEGMFAFVIFDRIDNSLTCVRDGFGIKPLFYACSQNNFLFASEQPAMLALRDSKNHVNLQRSYDYLVQGDYDSNEQTFVEGINQLMPGHYMVVNLEHPTAKQVRWWAPSIEQTCKLSFEDAVDRVRHRFLDNIRLHLRSDVALGAALSGGIDSSAVVCAMRYVEPNLPIHTFRYIAAGNQLSEEKWVDYINRYVGAQSHKVTAVGSDLATDLEELILAQGEPFGSTSIYAQYRVFKLARENGITVTLDGQGADELLAGYNGYPGYRILSLLETENIVLAHRFVDAWARWPGRSYKRAWMEAIGITLSDNLYTPARKWLGRDSSPSWLNIGLLDDAGVIKRRQRVPLTKTGKGRRVVEQLARSLQHRGLPALLRHGDRNSMRFSVESRVPFLTLPLAELLLSMPENYLISTDGQTKSIFRAAMRGIVPNAILDRKDKVGFATPEKEWLLGMTDTVRRWLEASVSIPFLKRDELLMHFDAVVTGKKEFSWQVWRWINYVHWFEQLGMTA
jgi:asparagine synthase (glutamine-hydrolysing)